MHELSLCQHILTVVEECARKQQLNTIGKIWLAIGDLAGVDSELIRYSFPIAAKDTLAEGAKLVIQAVPGQAYCSCCEKAFVLADCLTPCPQCLQYQYHIQQGQDFMVKRMEGS